MRLLYKKHSSVFCHLMDPNICSIKIIHWCERHWGNERHVSDRVMPEKYVPNHFSQTDSWLLIIINIKYDKCGSKQSKENTYSSGYTIDRRGIVARLLLDRVESLRINNSIFCSTIHQHSRFKCVVAIFRQFPTFIITFQLVFIQSSVSSYYRALSFWDASNT